MDRTDDIIFIRSLVVYFFWFIVAIAIIAVGYFSYNRPVTSAFISILTIGFLTFILAVYIIYILVLKLFYEKSFQFVIVVSALLNVVLVASLLSLIEDQTVLITFLVFYVLFVEMPRFRFYTDDLEPGLIPRFTNFFLDKYFYFVIGFFIFSLVIILLGIPIITSTQAILLIISNALMLILGWAIAIKLRLKEQGSKLLWALKFESIASVIVLCYGIVYDITSYFP